LRRDMLAAYRRDLWRDQPCRVEIWLEKQALVGVVYDQTDEWGVPLYPCRGYPSVTYLADAAAAIRRCGKPTHIFYFGDFDPSGLDIPRVVERRLRDLAPEAEIHFDRVAVTEDQIKSMCLPTRPTKRTDSRAKGFEGGSVELDAIPPDDLRAIVRGCIERHVDTDLLERTRRIEELERESLAGLRMPEVGGDD
ncbi:MAG: hypothetical protein R3B68_12850, partial [Phycisphaerales bacterium]